MLAWHDKAFNGLRCLAALTLLTALLSGCTSRGMTITSVPEGAEVSINRRVIGSTPIRVNYTHYGDYRVELRKDRYQTLVREEPVSPPWYGYDPMTFVADNVIPVRFNDEVYLHYVLNPVQEMNRDDLLQRANQARDGKVVNPRTGEQLEVAFTSQLMTRKAPRTVLQLPGEPVQPSVGPEPTPSLELPPPKQEPQEKPPAGPHQETSPNVKPIETKVETPKEQPKVELPIEQPKRMRRTPTGEVLIYEDQPAEDPNKKQEKK